MEDKSHLTDDESLDFLSSGGSRQKALSLRWRTVVTHHLRRKILDLLGQNPDREMYVAEIARTIGVSSDLVHQEIHHFERTRIAEVQRRSGRVYYKIRSGMVEQFQQWCETSLQHQPRPQHVQIVEVLLQRGKMYMTELAEALQTTPHLLQQAMMPLEKLGFIGNERRRKGSYGKIFYQIKPEMMGQCQQWLDSQLSDESKP